MISLKLLVIIAVSVIGAIGGVKQIYTSEGDVKVALVVHSCRNDSSLVPYRLQTLVSAALWTVQRVNYLKILTPLKLGLGVYEVCTDDEYYKIIFDLYQKKEDYLLGIVSDKNLNDKVLQFCEVLDIRTALTYHYYSYLVKSSIEVLVALGWSENVTILAPEENLLREFYRYSKRELVCVKDCLVYGNNCPTTINVTYPFVFFGFKDEINQFVKNQNFLDDPEDVNGLFIPLDGSVPDLPQKSYVIIPPHSQPSNTYETPENILPTPLLFEVAKPFLLYIKNVGDFIAENCNDTLSKINCLRSKFSKSYHPMVLTPTIMTEILKIEPLRESFGYDIFRVDNDTVTNLYR